MRLWSVHPKYLDSKGLVALWREALLAQKVLLGKTRGYQNHPQLERFRDCPDAESAIGSYLQEVYREARRRGSNFDRGKITRPDAASDPMPVPEGQLSYEMAH